MADQKELQEALEDRRSPLDSDLDSNGEGSSSGGGGEGGSTSGNEWNRDSMGDILNRDLEAGPYATWHSPFRLSIASRHSCGSRT
jgi:hypothetical protein